MANLQRALWVSTVATGAAAAAWMILSLRRTRPVRPSAERAIADPRSDSTRAAEIEELTQAQKDLMLRELTDYV